MADGRHHPAVDLDIARTGAEADRVAQLEFGEQVGVDVGQLPQRGAALARLEREQVAGVVLLVISTTRLSRLLSVEKA